MVPLSLASLALLAPHLTPIDAAGLIRQVREQPLGAIIDSTPAMLDPPSLDPPPDPDYPAFATDHVNRPIAHLRGGERRHAARVRPRARAWRSGPTCRSTCCRSCARSGKARRWDVQVLRRQLAKVADVKVNGAWRTYLMFGQGPGGTFYQTLDVTLTDMAAGISPEQRRHGYDWLSFFSQPDRIRYVCELPVAEQLRPSLAPYGDIAAAGAGHREDGGRDVVGSGGGPGRERPRATGIAILVGSGFFARSRELAPNRPRAPRRHDLLPAQRWEDGTLLDSERRQ